MDDKRHLVAVCSAPCLMGPKHSTLYSKRVRAKEQAIDSLSKTLDSDIFWQHEMHAYSDNALLWQILLAGLKTSAGCGHVQCMLPGYQTSASLRWLWLHPLC